MADRKGSYQVPRYRLRAHLFTQFRYPMVGKLKQMYSTTTVVLVNGSEKRLTGDREWLFARLSTTKGILSLYGKTKNVFDLSPSNVRSYLGTLYHHCICLPFLRNTVHAANAAENF